MVAPFVTPRTWLDIGTGYGHFCKDAAEVWPDTVFDGLDMGAGVEEGQRRGWLTNVYRGELPELAEQVAGKYDVLSMHHYLEHVTDPRKELDVVASIMKPGSYLLIEVPDPDVGDGEDLRQALDAVLPAAAPEPDPVAQPAAGAGGTRVHPGAGAAQAGAHPGRPDLRGALDHHDDLAGPALPVVARADPRRLETAGEGLEGRADVAQVGVARGPVGGPADPGHRRRQRLPRAGPTRGPRTEQPTMVDPANLDEAFVARRPAYQAVLAGGVDRFFGPRRDNCPWCGSPTLRTILRTGDRNQRKPGTFVLDGARPAATCSRTPMLTPAGLDFYYRDFYDGLAGREEAVFDTRSEITYRARQLPPFFPDGRAQALAGHRRRLRPLLPRRRRSSPDTVFDGLDLGQGVVEAAAKGWVDTAHRALPRPGRRTDGPLRRHQHVPLPRARPRHPRGAGPGGQGPAVRWPAQVEVPNPESPAAACCAAGGCSGSSRSTCTSRHCPTCSWRCRSAGCARSRSSSRTRTSLWTSPARCVGDGLRRPGAAAPLARHPRDASCGRRSTCWSGRSRSARLMPLALKADVR